MFMRMHTRAVRQAKRSMRIWGTLASVPSAWGGDLCCRACCAIILVRVLQSYRIPRLLLTLSILWCGGALVARACVCLGADVPVRARICTRWSVFPVGWCSY